MKCRIGIADLKIILLAKKHTRGENRRDQQAEERSEKGRMIK